MKLSRNLFAGAIAALAVAALITGVAVMDHAQAAAPGLGVVTMAMAGMVTIKAPVTVFYNGQYVAPGTDIEVSKEEAKRLSEAHGEYGGGAEIDPANTQMRNVDLASINSLNELKEIHKGDGRDTDKKTSVGTTTEDDDGKLTDGKLMALNKPELVAIAKELLVTHAEDATKQQITDAILAKQAEAEA